MKQVNQENNNTSQKGTARVLRIKVVNLLYLLFFVLAFLYIPADFVDIFKSINTNYEASIDDYYSKEYSNLYDYNLILFDYLIKKYEDSTRYKQNLWKVSQSVAEMIDRLEKYKYSLISLNGGYNEFNYLSSGKDYNYTEKFFLNEGYADTILRMLGNHKKFIKSVSDHDTYLKVDSLLNDNAELMSSNGRMIKWKKYYFNKMPVAGSVVLLSKFQNDLKRSENFVLESYIEKMKAEKDTLNIGIFAKIMADTILPILKKDIELKVKDKQIYRTGEKVDFAINISRKNLESIKGFVIKDEQQKQLTFEEEDGMLKASYFPYEEGTYSFYVFIGDDTLKKTIEVKEIKPVITSLGSDIFYTGIDNEVIVRHSNFSADQLTIIASRGEIVRRDSIFILNFRSDGKVDLKIFGKSEDGQILLSKETVAVFELPVSQPVIDNKYDGQITKDELIKQQRLKLINEFSGSVEVYNIKEFKVIRVSTAAGENEIKTVKNNGPVFSGGTSDLISKAETGDIYIFDYIKLEDKHGRITDAPSIVLTII